MSEWKTYKWGDLISLEYGKPIPDKNLLDGQYPVYGTNGRIGTSNLTPLCKHPSIIVGRKGAYRGVHYSNKPFSVIDTAFFVEPKTSILDLKWAYYKLLTVNINKMDSGSAIPSTDRYEIYSLSVELPSLDEQRRIAGILGSLDDKIELNRRLNANLEAQAQALFRSWFVDFEPFRDGPFVDSELGKIPQGWKICRLKDATKEIIRGFTSKYVEKSDLINLNQKVNKGQYLDRQYYKFLNPEIAIPTNKFAQQNDILLNSLGQGTLGRVHYYGELTPNIVIDQHITIIRANNTTFQPSFIYLFLSSNEVQYSIEGMVTGSTGMQMLNISQVREMNILQPDVNTMNKFHNIVQPFFVEIRKNNAETEIIAKIRDTLLPKLMAGEIKI